MRIDKLHFYYVQPNFLGKELEVHDLFASGRVAYSIARWAIMTKEERKGLNSQLSWCFGDVWGRAEYEWIVSDWPRQANGHKIDVYQAYVEPNKKLLLDMVNSVTPADARHWFKENGYTPSGMKRRKKN